VGDTLNVVTGAFSYTGKYIARRLLAAGERVRTLTGHPDRPDPFGGRVDVAPPDFERRSVLVGSLQGARTLYNTYWIRFPYGAVTFERAIANTKGLIEAAEEAGVRRIVHVSITGASATSRWPYFRGKGLAEELIARSALSYAILRPTVIFGVEDILINNIAWLLRRFPVFAVAGSGEYRVQPVFVDDVAALAVEAGHRSEDLVLDAAGPETYTYEALVRLIAGTVGSRARIVHVGPGLVRVLAGLVGGRSADRRARSGPARPPRSAPGTPGRCRQHRTGRRLSRAGDFARHLPELDGPVLPVLPRLGLSAPRSANHTGRVRAGPRARPRPPPPRPPPALDGAGARRS
jgi:uncharacterized protein YbjT (DUF2867 family)